MPIVPQVSSWVRREKIESMFSCEIKLCKLTQGCVLIPHWTLFNWVLNYMYDINLLYIKFQLIMIIIKIVWLAQLQHVAIHFWQFCPPPPPPSKHPGAAPACKQNKPRYFSLALSEFIQHNRSFYWSALQHNKQNIPRQHFIECFTVHLVVDLKRSVWLFFLG